MNPRTPNPKPAMPDSSPPAYTLSWTDLATPLGDALPEQVEIWLSPTPGVEDFTALSGYQFATSLPWQALQCGALDPLEAAFHTLNGHGGGEQSTWFNWAYRTLSVGDVLRFCVREQRTTVRLESHGWCELSSPEVQKLSSACPLKIPRADALRLAAQQRAAAERASDQRVAEWAVQQHLVAEQKARERPEVYGTVSQGCTTYRHSRPLDDELMASFNAQGYQVGQRRISGAYPWEITLAWH